MANKIKVLMVDDEAAFLESAVKVLVRMGFEVTSARSGEEALARVSSDRPEVVVLDLKMPGMSGHAVLSELRRRDPDLPVIVLTGHGNPDSALRGLREGVFEYLLKPCTMDLLAATITAAHAQKAGLGPAEPRVKDIMTSLSAFTRLHVDETVAEAIFELIESYSHTTALHPLHSTVHRTMLVVDDQQQVMGVITFRDILKALQDPYTRLAQGEDGDAAPPAGMFTTLVRDLATKKVKDIMSVAPPVIAGEATLLEAVERMISQRRRRLLVEEDGHIIGVIREQDLFFEIANIIKRYQTLR
jgi:FixJ family two-component response regulator